MMLTAVRLQLQASVEMTSSGVFRFRGWLKLIDVSEAFSASIVKAKNETSVGYTALHGGYS
jgi:hypothetical protein